MGFLCCGERLLGAEVDVAGVVHIWSGCRINEVDF